MNPDITASGISAAAKLLTELGDRALDPRPAFEAITDHIVIAEKRRFQQLGRSKASTTEAKRRDKDPRVRSHASQSGVATGELMAFMTTKGPKAQPAKLTKSVLVVGVPARHKLHTRAAFLVSIGKSPLVSRAVARRWATADLEAYLKGDLGPQRRLRRWP